MCKKTYLDSDIDIATRCKRVLNMWESCVEIRNLLTCWSVLIIYGLCTCMTSPNPTLNSALHSSWMDGWMDSPNDFAQRQRNINVMCGNNINRWQVPGPSVCDRLMPQAALWDTLGLTERPIIANWKDSFCGHKTICTPARLCKLSFSWPELKYYSYQRLNTLLNVRQIKGISLYKYTFTK